MRDCCTKPGWDGMCNGVIRGPDVRESEGRKLTRARVMHKRKNANQDAQSTVFGLTAYPGLAYCIVLMQLMLVVSFGS